MSGKHPIDELFAQALRDAEAQPPPAVWEGILRERGQRKGTSARYRRWWVYAAALLLLLGGAGYWALKVNEEPHAAGHEQRATSAPVTDAAPQAPGQPTTPRADAGPSQAIVPPAAPEQGDLTNAADRQNPETSADVAPNDRGRTRSPVGDERTEKSGHRGATAIGGSITANKTGNKGSAQKQEREGQAHSEEGDGPASLPVHDRKGSDTDVVMNIEHTLAVHERQGGVLQEAEAPHAIQVPALSTLPSPAITPSEARAPGPLLHGDTVPTYVLSKGHVWIGIQAEVSALEGAWKGTGPETAELNKSETWRGGQGFSLAAGYAWWSGWSVGLGIGVTRQRSRFLHQEVEGGASETVYDTTWTSYPAGPVTNYTWDIIETTRTEPGVAHDYSATNTYTQLRIGPEVGYRFMERKRLSVHGRFTPLVLLDVGRKGTTLGSVPQQAGNDTSTTLINVVPLTDASMDDRFPVRLAISAGIDLRYQVCDRWSLSASPTCTWWLPHAPGSGPSLSMTELGAVFRLRYDLRHQERRVK